MAGWKTKYRKSLSGTARKSSSAKLSKREMMRLGLLTAGGSLIVKQGLSSRAFGALSLTEKDPTFSTMPPSPPARPWAQPMPRLTVKTPVAAHDMLHGAPDGTTPIDGATKRVNHQYCSYDADTGRLRRRRGRQLSAGEVL